MIWTMVRASWIILSRDRVAQMLTFLLPVLFFTIFAAVFGEQTHSGTERIPIAVVDEDHSLFSTRLAQALGREAGLRVWRPRAARGQSLPESLSAPLNRRRGWALVHEGTVPVAVVLPRGLGDSFGRYDTAGATIQLLADPSDPIAPQVVQGLLQKCTMTAAPSLMARRGLETFGRYTGGLTRRQREVVERWLPTLDSSGSWGGARGAPAGGTAGRAADSAATARRRAAASGMVPVEVVDVMAGNQARASTVSFYAAGIAVMFLLFTTSSAGGSLLEQAESGTLERLLNSRLGMGGLLFSKWLFITLLGCLEILVMFVWGMLAFRLDLLHHLPGFALMTVSTAAAAASFGLVLAAASRSRAQLAGISTILILTMSALGGSMFPRFLMSPAMQKMGLCTFNAWALDGYIKVFWRNAAPWELWPQLGVLCGITVVFLALARLLARRWESA
ncbi:MAG TPA: ABC transporter permease [Candidatus Saccharimonadales bacterium]|nr:ABC transporter permease [Candidatus Saccharimonadales bacterium]